MATTEDIHEPVDVLTIFRQGTIRPVRIRWAGRTHTIDTVQYEWVTREGTQPVRHFAVTLASGALCELTLHTHALRWTLCSVQMDG